MIEIKSNDSLTPPTHFKHLKLQDHHFHVTPPVFDSYCPFRGYEHRGGLLATPLERARDAYYQGFISLWEFNAINLDKAFIETDGTLIFHDRPAYIFGVPTFQELTAERAILIQGNHLLGLSDGKTLYHD